MSIGDVLGFISLGENKGDDTAIVANTAAISELSYPTVVPTAISKTLTITDAGTIQKATAAATITVPPNSSVAFPTSTQISIAALTASDVAIAAGSGVTIRSKDSKLKIDGQYASASLLKIDTDEWLLVGALKA